MNSDAKPHESAGNARDIKFRVDRHAACKGESSHGLVSCGDREFNPSSEENQT
jgi:hypothetical protein